MDISDKENELMLDDVDFIYDIKYPVLIKTNTFSLFKNYQSNIFYHFL